VLPSEKLTVTNSWVLFVRKRSGDLLLEDIRRLKVKVEQATELPPVVESFITPGDENIRQLQPEQPFRGLAASEAGAGAMELYFPMAYNDEQVSIVQKLHRNDGVVVQGPPGTGKTHTIANVICHYLAQGKRVLVTAKGETALSVLQEKLPEQIRPLSVSLLSDERDGMKQFEHAIQTIASSVSGMNAGRSASNIANAEQQLDLLHAKISHVDRQIGAYAAKHMQPVTFHGRQVTPEELAKLVLEQADEHEWFDDEPEVVDSASLPFTDSDIAALRRARMAVTNDLPYAAVTLPDPASFPQWLELLRLHRDLVTAKGIEEDVDQGHLLRLVDTGAETFIKAEALTTFLAERTALMAKLAAGKKPWHEAMMARMRDMQAGDEVLATLLELCGEIRTLAAQRRERLKLAISVPADAERNADFCAAVTRLVAGKSAFVLPFGRGDARKLVAAVTVTGATPGSAADWKHVEEHLAWRTSARKLIARWTALESEFGLETPDAEVERGFRTMVEAEVDIGEQHKLVFEYDGKLHARLAEVFSAKLAERVWDEAEAFVELARDSLQAHVQQGRLAYAMQQVHGQLKLLEGHGGAVVEELRNFLLHSLGDPLQDATALQSAWIEAHGELVRLSRLHPHFEVIGSTCASLEKVQATKWAKRCRTEPATQDLDVMTPTGWAQAWDWRQAVMFLDSIEGHHELGKLFEERRSLTGTLSRTYQELVAEKTWLGVYNNSPDSVRQALQAYLSSIQAMGSGTGVRAVRHRRNAREAMLRAYKAVPCWVLPQWRVSEAIPPELGLFDLVIIDEASQSDIWALPALLRGKKLLVVGDHKQVSPSAVGIAEDKITELMRRFLANQPFGSEMTPDKSIYDLARVVFAGNSVMLKEHFRCVPAIIEFSNREFYQNEIKPLRVPRANERLDPPLIDVFVKGGHKNKKQVNEAEAQAIVAEIEAILADPQMTGRSIGVVTLLGTEQAKRLHELVNERISTVDVAGVPGPRARHHDGVHGLRAGRCCDRPSSRHGAACERGAFPGPRPHVPVPLGA
jgi:hypothetical protein